jgi:4-amino-4-deoxy-L-arabinose transferase-like glycosyltransferase
LALVLTAVVAISAILTLYRLGAADVCGFNEAVEGVFLQQMVEHGHLLFPLDNGRAPMYKPPLFHWTATAIDRMAGIERVNAFNLRLPSALYAIAGAALTVIFTYDFMGLPAALIAGLILCGSYQFIEQGRLGRVDMALCFFETLALFSFSWWLASREQADSRNWLRYLFAAALGLAVLSKGPIGAILPAGACGIFLLAERRFIDLRRIIAPGPVLLTLVIGSSWYIACYFAGRETFLNRQLGSENFGRFFGALGAMKPWYYVKPILLNSAPLSLIAPFAIYAALRTYWLDAQPALDRHIRVVRLFAIFWLVTILFFSVAAYKRRAYLLPLWPATAVILTWSVEELRLRRREGRINFAPPIGRVAMPGMVALAAGSILFNFFYLPGKAIRDCGDDSLRSTAAQINRIVGKQEPLYSFKLGDEPAELVFYLDRNAPPIKGRLGDAPPGYVIAPAAVWAREKDEALDLTPVFESSSGRPRIVLLRHGPALASIDEW